MSIYHPIFDQTHRKWDLPGDFDVEFWEAEWGGKIIIVQVPKGSILRLLESGVYYLATEMMETYPVEPHLETMTLDFWNTYIVPHIIEPPMIDMKGELDGDDIELAQIIMDEIEEGKKI